MGNFPTSDTRVEGKCSPLRAASRSNDLQPVQQERGEYAEIPAASSADYGAREINCRSMRSNANIARSITNLGDWTAGCGDLD